MADRSDRSGAIAVLERGDRVGIERGRKLELQQRRDRVETWTANPESRNTWHPVVGRVHGGGEGAVPVRLRELGEVSEQNRADTRARDGPPRPRTRSRRRHRSRARRRRGRDPLGCARAGHDAVAVPARAGRRPARHPVQVDAPGEEAQPGDWSERRSSSARSSSKSSRPRAARAPSTRRAGRRRPAPSRAALIGTRARRRRRRGPRRGASTPRGRISTGSALRDQRCETPPSRTARRGPYPREPQTSRSAWAEIRDRTSAGSSTWSSMRCRHPPERGTVRSTRPSPRSVAPLEHRAALQVRRACAASSPPAGCSTAITRRRALTRAARACAAARAAWPSGESTNPTAIVRMSACPRVRSDRDGHGAPCSMVPPWCPPGRGPLGRGWSSRPRSGRHRGVGEQVSAVAARSSRSRVDAEVAVQLVEVAHIVVGAPRSGAGRRSRARR